MQTQNIKAVRTKDDRLFIFYYSGNAVFCRQIQKGLNAQPTKIIENVYPMFSLWCSDSGIYLLCKGSGGVTLCFYNYSRWVSKLISQDADTSYSKMSFFTIGEAVHILYSVKSGDEGLETLYVRSMNKENWAPPLKIADIMPFGSTAYFVGREIRRLSTVHWIYAAAALRKAKTFWPPIFPAQTFRYLHAAVKATFCILRRACFHLSLYIRA